MRKSISNPSLSRHGHIPLFPGPRRSPSNTSLSSMVSTEAPVAITVAVSEAVSHASLQTLGTCTEIFGFPSELIDQQKNTQAYIACLAQPDDPVPEEPEPDRASSTNANANERLERQERMARWLCNERRRRRRWSFMM